MTRQPGLHRRAAAGIVAVTLALTGTALGAVWSMVAPPIHTITALTTTGKRVDGFLGRDAENVFVGAAMMVGLLSMLAVVSAVAVWQWRAHRGPVMVTTLWTGQVLAAGTATAVGAALAHWRYGPADHLAAPLSPENRVHYFTEAPPVFFGHNGLQITLTLLLPAALGALAYALMTLAAPRDDLGGWPPEGYQGPAWPLPPRSAQIAAQPTVVTATADGREPGHPG
ncbi:MAG: DUF2567 domain-containing protein [Mycobacterium sp.]|nr:DUF2567 domain-containing protein [Mycobacterium sp.]